MCVVLDKMGSLLFDKRWKYSRVYDDSWIFHGF